LEVLGGVVKDDPEYFYIHSFIMFILLFLEKQTPKTINH